MAILYCGGEPNDFYSTNETWIIQNFTGYRYSIYNRHSIELKIKDLWSPTFTPQSSLWLHFVRYNGNNGSYCKIGFMKSGTDAFIGIYSIGTSQLRLYKYDGSTYTQLTTGSNIFSGGTLSTIDIQISNYGSNGTINCFVNGQLDCTYTGDIAVLGQTTLDYFYFQNTSSLYSIYVSEIIAADEDTRAMHLATLYPNAAGDQNQWTGAYTDVDDQAPSDGDMLYTDSASQNAQLGVANLDASINAKVRDVHIHSRSAVSAGSSLDLKQGVKTNSVIHVGSAHTLDVGWDIYTDSFNQNPQTSQEWTISDINALQIALQSQ